MIAKLLNCQIKKTSDGVLYRSSGRRNHFFSNQNEKVIIERIKRKDQEENCIILECTNTDEEITFVKIPRNIIKQELQKIYAEERQLFNEYIKFF